MYYSTGHYTRQISSNLHFTFRLLWVHYQNSLGAADPGA